MVTITILFDKNRITSSEVSVVGIQGQACMLITPDILRRNPDARISPTEEYNMDTEDQLKETE